MSGTDIEGLLDLLRLFFFFFGFGTSSRLADEVLAGVFARDFPCCVFFISFALDLARGFVIPPFPTKSCDDKFTVRTFWYSFELSGVGSVMYMSTGAGI